MTGATDFGHGEKLNRRVASSRNGECARTHPVIDGVGCERPKGHPGEHVARLRSAPREVVLEWEDDGEGVSPARPSR